jgi:hypothetical protein
MGVRAKAMMFADEAGGLPAGPRRDYLLSYADMLLEGADAMDEDARRLEARDR